MLHHTLLLWAAQLGALSPLAAFLSPEHHHAITSSFVEFFYSYSDRIPRGFFSSYGILVSVGAMEHLSIGPAHLFLSPTITLEKLNGKNYLSWYASIELWFLGQGFHNPLEKDHSEKDHSEISLSVEQGNKLDIKLCALLCFGNLWNLIY